MFKLFESEYSCDITPFDELCRECRLQETESSFYLQVLEQYFEGCTCEDKRKYRFVYITVSLPEIKIPSECVFYVSFYESNTQLEDYNSESHSDITFSFNRTMEINPEKRDILIKYKGILNVALFDIYYNPEFKGLKPKESYFKQFLNTFQTIIETKPIIEEKKQNPHMKKKGKKI